MQLDQPWWKRPSTIVLALIFLPPAGIILMYLFLPWSADTKKKAAIASGVWFLIIMIRAPKEPNLPKTKGNPPPAVATKAPIKATPPETPAKPAPDKADPAPAPIPANCKAMVLDPETGEMRCGDTTEPKTDPIPAPKSLAPAKDLAPTTISGWKGPRFGGVAQDPKIVEANADWNVGAYYTQIGGHGLEAEVMIKNAYVIFFDEIPTASAVDKTEKIGKVGSHQTVVFDDQDGYTVTWHNAGWEISVGISFYDDPSKRKEAKKAALALAEEIAAYTDPIIEARQAALGCKKLKVDRETRKEGCDSNP